MGAGHGDVSGAGHRFVQALDEAVPARSADECVGAAVETFEALIRWVAARAD